MASTVHGARLTGILARAAGWAARGRSRRAETSAPEQVLATGGARAGAWTVLTTRRNEDLREPTAGQLGDAIRELFSSAGSDEPGGASRITHGVSNGSVFVLEFTSAGGARFEEWVDEGFERERAPARVSAVRDGEEALRLWTLLAAGDVEAVRSWSLASGADQGEPGAGPTDPAAARGPSAAR